MASIRELKVLGHLSAAAVGELKRIVERNGLRVKIDATPTAGSENFGIDESVVSIAGAVAGIISCVVALLQYKEQRKQVSAREHEAAIDAALKQVGDGTYERVGAIMIRGGVTIESAEEFTVTLRDVPGARLIVVQVSRLERVVVIDSTEIADE
jgi:hypothetical protein